MTPEFEELKKLINDAIDESKADRKKLWYEDREEKAECDGAIGAYNYCLSMIKLVNHGKE